MDVRNCRKCGKVFNYIAGAPICPACREAAEKVFDAVKTFIKENPEANIEEISEKCDVTTHQIVQWIREERLSFTKESVIGINCEGCGVSIKTGRYCDKCKYEISKGFNVGMKKRDDKDSMPISVKKTEKMRFIDN